MSLLSTRIDYAKHCFRGQADIRNLSFFSKMTVLNKEMEIQLENLISKLKRSQIKGSFEVTIEIIKLFKIIIAGGRWNELSDLIEIANEMNRRTKAAQPIEFAIDSTMNRIRHLIVEENMEYEAADTEEAFRDYIKPLLLEGLAEFADEVELSISNISNQAFDHIQSRFN
jgi:translation initiation factor 2B subunit (eIF-2B alpha/beta/delta family)